MNRSKISRSILVVVFVAFIVVLAYFDIRMLLTGETTSQGITSRLGKVVYAICLIALTIAYVFMKDKLYRMKVKRKQSLMFRYCFLGVLVICTSIFMVKQEIASMSILYLIAFLTFKVITAFVIKKIIFNVSKSDMLSVFALVAYAMLPNVILEEAVHIGSLVITLVISSAILCLQFLIDELKQRGIKTHKYIWESLLLGVLLGFTTLLGVPVLAIILLALVLLLITVNLDYTHINFPKALVNAVGQNGKERLYSIERINVNKMLISILLSLAIAIMMYGLGNILIPKSVDENSTIPASMVTNFNQNRNMAGWGENASHWMENIVSQSKIFLAYSKTYYLILFIYLIGVELLAFLLKRRYDTKSTALKMIFVLLFLSISFFSLDMTIFQPVLSILLMLIAIVNTSNIYLNREERVKMLVA